MVRLLISILCRHVTKATLLAVLAASAAVAVLEVVALALILPLLLLIAGNAGDVSALPQTLQTVLVRITGVADLATLAGLLAGVIVVKNLAMAAVFDWQTRVARRGAIALGAELVHGYLHAPMAFHLSRRTAQYVRSLRDLPEGVWFRGGLGLCNLVAEIAGVAGLTLAMALVEPVGVGIAMLFLGALLVLNQVVMGGRFQRWGAVSGRMIRALYALGGQVFANVKLIRVSAAEATMIARIGSVQRDVLDLERKRRFAQLALRPISEIAMLGSGIIILIVGLYDSAGPTAALPLLAVFGFGAVRLLPAINRISMYTNDLKFTRAALLELQGELNAIAANPPTPMRAGTLNFERTLELRGITYRYGEDRHPALNGIDLTLAQGEIVGVAGVSGAGKSTLVDTMLGLLKPQAGEILVDGAAPRPGGGCTVGYAAQGSPVLDMTIRENITLGVATEDIDAAALAEAIAAAALSETVANLPDGVDTLVGEHGVGLSGGQRQRVALARALYRRPRLVVLDEATSDLDMTTEAEVGSVVENLRGRCTVLLVAHRLHLLKRCDRILFMRAGRVVAEGRYDALIEIEPDFARMVAAAEQPPRRAESVQSAEAP
ncbi:MAG: ABC transporter ATP-binding protein [Pseudomonadota bacterium]